jgi:hypothetical protein
MDSSLEMSRKVLHELSEAPIKAYGFFCFSLYIQTPPCLTKDQSAITKTATTTAFLALGILQEYVRFRAMNEYFAPHPWIGMLVVPIGINIATHWILNSDEKSPTNQYAQDKLTLYMLASLVHYLFGSVYGVAYSLGYEAKLLFHNIKGN